jgi:hypothetical protein
MIGGRRNFQFGLNIDFSMSFTELVKKIQHRSHRRVFYFPVVSIICLCSCGGYGSVNRFWQIGSNGYDDVAVDSITYQVKYFGFNADKLVLYRAAEITDQRGYDYFVVSDSHPVDFAGTAGILKTIRLFNGKTPTENTNAFGAKSILNTMGQP